MLVFIHNDTCLVYSGLCVVCQVLGPYSLPGVSCSPPTGKGQDLELEGTKSQQCVYVCANDQSQACVRLLDNLVTLLAYQHLKLACKEAVMRTLTLKTCSHRQPEQHGPWSVEEEGA